MKRLLLLIISFFICAGTLHAGDLNVNGTVKAYYLYPGLGTGDPYRFIKFGDNNTPWGGFMWNNTSNGYGDGDDFTIYTYDNRDIVLQPGGGKIVLGQSSGTKIGIGTTNPEQKLDVIGNAYISGNVGLGASNSGDNKLYLIHGLTDANWGNGAYFYTGVNYTYSDTYHNKGLVVVLRPQVNDGITNSGSSIALEASNLYTSTQSGTIDKLYGARIYYGNYDTGTANINNAYGLYILPKHEGGHIQTSIGLLIGEPTGGGTVDDYWGIYQAGGSTRNYIAGSVGIGKSPTEKLDVSGNANISGALTVGSGGNVLKNQCTQATLTCNTHNCQVSCPSGRTMTGGGGSCDHNQVMYQNRPAGAGSWFVQCGTGETQVTAYAICCAY